MSNQFADLESPEVFNAQLKEALVNADDGLLKNASEKSTNMVRRRIRENGYGRLILPFTPATDAMLAPSLVSELPHIIEEMEPLSPDQIATTATKGGNTLGWHLSGRQGSGRHRTSF